MLARSAFLAAFLLLFSTSLFAQTVTQASCGDDGKAHLTFRDMSRKTVPPERELKQVGCDEISVADDHHTVAWCVLIENCCTSYPIPVVIVVYKNGRKTLIHSPQMVWQWHFVDRGTRIAVLSGPVHGWPAGAALFDTTTGKKLESWDGSDSPPEWAETWENDFAGRDQ